MIDQRRIARQEQRVDEARRRAERAERTHALMVEQVEREVKILDEMLKLQEDFTSSMQNMGTTPNLGNATSPSFKSQFDQFSTNQNNQRLTTGNDKGIDFTGKLITPIETAIQPQYSTRDGSDHWTTLDENPGKKVFVSGRYVSTQHGTHRLASPKEYEYELSTRALPVTVGDVLQVPVHPTGHGDGKEFSTSYLNMQVTDIYSTPKFHAYHDIAEN